MTQTRHIANVVSHNSGERKSLTVLLDRCDFDAIVKIAREHDRPTGTVARAMLKAELIRIDCGEEEALKWA
jgi:hypothetical protein